ncbi:MAG: ABC transporter permease [Firmicutes bacterium]|nr:ABC transporter permease [Bacillota bacterium]
MVFYSRTGLTVLCNKAGGFSVSRLAVHKDKIPSIIFLFVALISWEGLVRFLDLPPFLLPGPINVLRELYFGLAGGVFLVHTWVTFQEIIAGFVLGVGIGFILGVLISEIRIVEQTIYPYVVALQALPKMAIAPLFVIWFGFGITSKIVITALVALFPVLVNVIVGLQTVDAKQLDLMNALNGSKWQTFRMCKLPSALPIIFAGLEIAIVLAVIGAIVGEFVGAEAGLGYLILLLNFKLQIATVFAVLIILSLIGVLLHYLVRLSGKKIVFWVGEEKRVVIGG